MPMPSRKRGPAQAPSQPTEEVYSPQERLDAVLKELGGLTTTVLSKIRWVSSESGYGAMAKKEKSVVVGDRTYTVSQLTQVGETPFKPTFAAQQGRYRLVVEFCPDKPAVFRREVFSETGGSSTSSGISSTALRNPEVAAALYNKLEMYLAEFGEAIAKESRQEVSRLIEQLRENLEVRGHLEKV